MSHMARGPFSALFPKVATTSKCAMQLKVRQAHQGEGEVVMSVTTAAGCLHRRARARAEPGGRCPSLRLPGASSQAPGAWSFYSCLAAV